MGTFELSAYGVEEMTKQEMLFIDGGNLMYELCKEVVKIVCSGAAWDAIRHTGYQFYTQFCTREIWDSIVDAC